MPATAASAQPWGSDVDAYYGASVHQPFLDLSARRHMMPSIMDGPLAGQDQCRCPGGPESENSCIDRWTHNDGRLCLMCHTYCYATTEDGKQILFVELYGSLLPSASPEVESATVTE